jgi:anti-sigma B factor antagonist
VCGHNISMDKAEINIASSSDGAVVSLCGRVDIDSSPAVRDRLLALLNAPHPSSVTIDLSAVTHIDSSGIATLIEALKVARAHKTEMRLQGLEDRLLRFFDITGILSLFNRERPNMSEPGNKAL